MRLCRRDRNIYCCLYKLNAWRMCKIPQLRFASKMVCSNALAQTWLKLGYRIGLGESVGDKGSGERGVITKAKKETWYKIQGMCVLKHTYRPVVSVWEGVSVCPPQLMPFA